MFRILAIACLTALPATACETALLLAIDVSGSINGGDYAVQTEGLATALSDPEVAEALVKGQVALAVVQWSGLGEQALVAPWARMLDDAAVTRFAGSAATLPRAYKGSDTAVGDAVSFALGQFTPVADCTHRVIDISGDGQENAGFTDARARSEAVAAEVTINAIAIEAAGQAFPITSYYQRWVVTPGGFVVSARGVADYAETLRLKLLRELADPIG